MIPIPFEIWSMILDYLDVIELHKQLQVCKLWNKLSESIINRRLGIGKEVKIDLDDLAEHYAVPSVIYAARYNRFDILTRCLTKKYYKAFYKNVRFVKFDIINVLLKQKKITLGAVFQHLPCGHPLVPKLLRLVNESNLGNIMKHTPPSRHPNLYIHIEENFKDLQSTTMRYIWNADLSDIKKLCVSSPSMMEFMEHFAVELNNANLAMVISTHRRQYASHTCDASPDTCYSL